MPGAKDQKDNLAQHAPNMYIQFTGTIPIKKESTQDELDAR